MEREGQRRRLEGDDNKKTIQKNHEINVTVVHKITHQITVETLHVHTHNAIRTN